MRAERVALVCMLLACVGAAGAGRARAQQGPAWPDDARRAAPVEYAAVSVLAVSALALALYEPGAHRHTGPWLFDGGVRSGLRLDSESGRDALGTVSDIGLWTLVTYPFFNALLAATVLDAERPLPLEMAVQSALVLSGAAFVTYLSKDLFARERPFGAACRADAGYAPECGDKTPASFFSGHAALTFAAATISCVQHAKLNLYGDPTADAAACAAALALASAVSVMRVVSDQHYATDVLAGAAVGALSGLGLGLLLHY
jgi:membrane-associated phospholipid phosphatase